MTMIIEAVKSRKMKNKRIRSRFSGGSSCMILSDNFSGLTIHGETACSIKFLFEIAGNLFPKLLLGF